MAKGILIAAMDFTAVAEDEFHDWYDTEHIPERLAVPGFINAERFIGIDNPKVSVALYDLDSREVLFSEPYKKVGGANGSPWTKRVTGRTKGLIRMEGEQMRPGDKLAPIGDAAAILLISMNVAPEPEAEFNAWYNEEHLDALGGGARGAERAALSRHRLDPEICRDLSLRARGGDRRRRLEDRRQHALDRKDAAAFPRLPARSTAAAIPRAK